MSINTPMDTILGLAKKYESNLCRHRRYLHENPEVGLGLQRIRKCFLPFVKKQLKKFYNSEKYAPAPGGTQHVVFLLVLGKELSGKKNRHWL